MYTISIKKGSGRRCLAPLLFLVILTLSTHKSAAEWQDVLYALQSFPQLTIIEYDDIFSKKGNIFLEYRYDDIYRKKVSALTALQLQGSHVALEFFTPFQVSNTNHVLRGHLSYDRNEFSNRQDPTAVTCTAHSHNGEVSLAWSATRGIGQLGAACTLEQTWAPMKIHILNFPTSENSRLNQFFLDWLPPTFGNQQNGDICYRHFDFSLWGSSPLPQKRRVRLLLKKSYQQYDALLHYTNTTPFPSLQGDRRIGLPLHLTETNANLALFTSQPMPEKIDIGLIWTQLNFDIRNYPLSELDFKDLGDADLTRFGGYIRTALHLQRIRISGGIGGTGYSGNFDIRTPVLGYYQDPLTQLQILPIAHAAEGTIQQGRSLTLQTGFEYRASCLRIDHLFSLEMLYSKYWFRFDGEALLEFGLYATPLEYMIRFRLSTFNLRYSAEKRSGNISITYQVQQLIPLFRRLDDSPVRFREEVPAKKVRERGGQFHTLRMNYYF